MGRLLIYLFGAFIINSVAIADEGGLEPPGVECRPATAAIQIDGSLDDPAWKEADWESDFRQGVPEYNQPATEQTSVAFLHDEQNLYIGVRCLDSEPASIIATKIRHRDNPRRDDFVEVVFDTYRDQVRGYMFTVNPLGAKEECQINGARSYNWDWDEIWDVSTSMTTDGWQAEFRIPLKILRFKDDEVKSWGVNVHRQIRRKREDTYLVPPSPPHDVSSLNYSAELSGISGVSLDRDIQVMPYILSGGKYDYEETDGAEFLGEYGADLKYALTSDLTLDVTFNTDFAQVEADNEQVNLSRFSLFFPEKREFFLENAQLFNFGSGRSLMPFFSRRIGLSDDGDQVPIDVGARLTGKYGDNDIGLLSVRAAEVDELAIDDALYNVVRIRHSVGGRSYVGGIATSSNRGEFNSATVGVDGQWYFTDKLRLNSYYTIVEQDELDEGTSAWETRLDYTSDPFGFMVALRAVGENYEPDLGYVQRQGFDNRRVHIRRSFRMHDDSMVRRYSLQGWSQWTYGDTGPLESANNGARVEIDFESGDNLQAKVEQRFERLYEPFELSDEITYGIDDYRYTNATIRYRTSSARRWNAHAQLTIGDFYDGTRQDISGSFGYIFNRHFSASGSLTNYSIEHPGGRTDWQIWRGRINYIHNAYLSVAGLFQYNSSSGAASANLRLRLIHSNDSDLFIVFNERRINEFDRWQLASRDGVVKMNYRIFL